MTERGERYQIALIVLGIAVSALLAYFLFREIYPEYKIYQKDYNALEEFRSSYTGEAPPILNLGIKQIVFEREDKGPAKVDRCVSCHVALQLPHFSPTKVAEDEQGQVVRNPDGSPLLVPNEDYIWTRLDQKIAELQDSKVNDHLTQQGEANKVAARLQEAEYLASLKIAEVGEYTYDVTKVLQMHPLIGKETRPFEFHSIDEYGCTSCHSGNGRGLTTDKAHGPVFDGYYEAEFTGHTPQFIEHDPENDPRFAKVFNSKPSDALLFQTTPILVGNLIQASCVQCHKAQGISTAGLEEAEKQPDIDLLTKDYHRGEQLFISQACYACHRITGLARGGIGPELTRSGENYPWFLKRKLQWPQGDLKNSTMPNYRLDTEELEDLMIFLLAQKGPSSSISNTDYKKMVRQWEGGLKQPWEKEIAPTQIRDLNYSMTVFATEGCAACHRLEGYTSNVGFAVEKGEKTDFDTLFKEKQWFSSLFPEEAPGSQIASTLEKYSEEIDKRIINDVRQGSLLEEIEAKNPDLITSFYSNFRFAERAKNKEYTNEDQLKAWKDRVRRVLMMYVQQYGLGRLVGPRPNWSGVYRSDEWLMSHFHNPAAHVPRSIMPIFPFDESKFYALTYLLDVIGKKNRDALDKLWNEKGFDPEAAYMAYCAQCHGDYMQGNGPVAAWIYPIPKNLRNAEFMRNLTKERAIESITHGVKGTPMAPWGETPKDKMTYDGIPVLSKAEIEKLVDWLFASIPGSTVIRGAHDIPKWNYTTENVVEELNREGSVLQPKPADAAYFDVVHSTSGEDKNLYYIKKEFYTPENIDAGRNFFHINCAVCHGNDADGSGLRASIMSDAKPRMLTNLDWIKTRDDLRLLRSIKFGVAGTSMTPWGDFTSSLQRMQLVMYIRSLTFEKDAREQLIEQLYETFLVPQAALEKHRIERYADIEKLEQQLSELKNKRKAAESAAQIEVATSSYGEQLKLEATLKELQNKDQEIVKLIRQLNKEKETLQSIGNEIIAASLEENALWQLFLQIIPLSAPEISFDKENVSYSFNKENQKKVADLKDQLQKLIDKQIAALEKQKTVLEAKLPSPAVAEEKKDNTAQLTTYTKLKTHIQSGVRFD